MRIAISIKLDCKSHQNIKSDRGLGEWDSRPVHSLGSWHSSHYLLVASLMTRASDLMSHASVRAHHSGTHVLGGQLQGTASWAAALSHLPARERPSPERP